MLRLFTDSPRVAVMKGPHDYREPTEIHPLVERALEALDVSQQIIRPGDRVVIKPNWIKEHDERFVGPGHWEHVVTHPMVIEGVVFWAAKRLAGEGSITICDAPQTDSSFATLRQYCSLDQVVDRCAAAFPNLRFSILDLRPEEWHTVDGVTVRKTSLPGDPYGLTHVHLDSASEFVGFSGLGRLYGASWDLAETNGRHDGTRHEYLLSRTPMDADVFINLPKLKTHKKVGITCALKNLVGINANKNWLPHHTEGTPAEGGDQFPESTFKARLEHNLMGAFKRRLNKKLVVSRGFVPVKKLARLYFGDTQRVVRSGNWSGNDTCWRMVLDLNKCLFYFDGAATPRRTPLRYLAVVDGIIAGEGNGPMAPDPMACGILIAGSHPVAVDCVCARLMGFDWRKIRLLENSFKMQQLSFVPFNPKDIEVVSNQPAWRGGVDQINDTFSFRPHFGWIGAIETNKPCVA